MRTPIIIDDIEVKAIIDTGAAASAITSELLKETQYRIEEKSNTRCIMANGTKIASLGKTEIKIEIGEIITPVTVEVIDSKDWTLIIGNDFLGEWNSNINFESETLTLQDNEITIQIPVTYTRQKKVTFEVPEEDDEEDDEEDEYETEEEIETFNIQDLEEEEISSDEEVK
jgi:predicted aspartyl protease